jgi:hypothetical protein
LRPRRFSVVDVELDTLTDDWHEATRCNASTAVHVSAVEPTGKSDPDGGVHALPTGVAPPVTAGENVTTTGLPSSDVAVGVGHVIAGGGGGPYTRTTELHEAD